MNKKTVSKIMLILLLLGMLTLAFNIQPVKASGTIYIRPDGSIEGTDKIQRDGDVYTFTDNIYDKIVVERSNIIVDGKGYTLQGSGSGMGFDLTRVNNVTIQNTNIKEFRTGIYLDYSDDNTLTGNNIAANNGIGVWVRASWSNIISGNNITNNNYHAIGLEPLSTSNGIHGNNITNNKGNGIWLEEGSNSNNISRNNIKANRKKGIAIVLSSNNNVHGNNITNNNGGIYTLGGPGNTISGNNITANNDYGINLVENSFIPSAFNIIYGNIITGHNFGIYLRGHEYPIRYNTICGNNIINNICGVWLDDSLNNKFYHNNFVDNTEQVYSDGLTNVWDDGYPSGGNYWCDHVTVDVCCGINQDELGSDGIGDAPYVIDGNNQDNYPFMATSDAIDYVIQSLPSSEFTKPEEDVEDMKNDFADKFADVEENVEEGDFERAIEHLEEIRDFVLEQIVESTERQEIISMIDGLIAYLENFL